MHNFIKLAEFLSSYSNITSWSIGPAFNSLYIDKDRFDRIKVSYNEVIAIYNFVEKNMNEYHFEISLDRSFLDKKYFATQYGSSSFEGAKCSANINHFLILPNGQVTICEQLYWNPRFIIGDITKNSIKEIWNSSRASFFANLSKKNIRVDSPCHSCNIFDKCHTDTNKCWVEILKAYGDDNWDFPDPRCAFAPEMLTDLRF